MTIEDITPGFLTFWEHAKGRDRATQRRLWRELYEEPHRAIFDACYRSHGDPNDLESALARFPVIAPRLREAMPRLHRQIERFGPALASLFEASQVAPRFVLMVGLFHSDGWVEVIDGAPVCFLAVEVIEDLDGAGILAAHEAAHGYHLAINPPFLAEMENVGHALFLEGLAVLASARIEPGHGDGVYLWAGRRTTVEGQAPSGWVNECEGAWESLRTSLIHDLESTDEETYAAYFLGGRSHDRLPIRAGYFAGYRLVAELSEEYPIAELARWPVDRALEAVASALSDDRSARGRQPA